MLQVERIDVYYGEVQVLWDVSFQVEEGKVVALLGSNGAGKSTALNTISGLLRPRRGRIAFLEHEISALPDFKMAGLGIAHVPEGRRLFPEMTVKENLDMGSLVPQAKTRRRETMAWVLELFPLLAERSWQEAGTLSGGEAQMLAIARGLMLRPKLLMLDEPSLGLAPMLVNLVFEIVKQVNGEGVTILLVEQNVAHALRCCDDAYILENGKIVLQGSGGELLKNERIKASYLGV